MKHMKQFRIPGIRFFCVIMLPWAVDRGAFHTMRYDAMNAEFKTGMIYRYIYSRESERDQGEIREDRTLHSACSRNLHTCR